MMGRKQFSYPNLRFIKSLFMLFILYLFFWEKLVKITLAEFFWRCYCSLTFIQVYISGRMTWELGTGFSLTAKTMNNLLQIREKIKRANRLYEAQLLATKSGEVTPYRRSVFEERIRITQKEMKLKDSKN